ncbi:MAG: hypothetical protein AB1503_07205 [Bacillota bacterium]
MTPREQLAAALRGGRLAHCYLLCGPRARSEEAAREVAGACLCLARGSDRPDPAQACGACPSCRALRQGTHPDLRRWEAERGTWRIEQVRALIGEAFRRPTLGDRRVHILGDVHLLSLPSANALLKLLEEPPPGTLFLLLADRVADLPATLLSRCQLLAWPGADASPGEGATLGAEAPLGEGAGPGEGGGTENGSGSGQGARTGEAGPSLAREVLQAAGAGRGSHLLILAKRLAERGEKLAAELAGLIRERVVGMASQGEEVAIGPWLRAWEAVDRAAARLEAHGNSRLVWECLLLELAGTLGGATVIGATCPSCHPGL